MNPLEIQIDMDINSLMNSISELRKSALDPYRMPFIARNANDIELAYSQLARLVDRVRGYQRNAVVPMQAAE